MKGSKVLSVTSLLAAVAFTTTGCGCSISQKKIDASSSAIKETSLDADFIVEYNYSDNVNDANAYTATISRDNDKKKYYLTKGDVSYTVFAENGTVFYQKGEEAKEATGYTSADLSVMNHKDLKQFYALSIGAYENFKSVPYYACSSAAKDKREETYGISSLDLDSIKCKAEKPLFGKNVTYKIEYRHDGTAFWYITIKLDKNNKITYFKLEEQVADGVHKWDVGVTNDSFVAGGKTYTINYEGAVVKSVTCNGSTYNVKDNKFSANGFNFVLTTSGGNVTSVTYGNGDLTRKVNEFKITYTDVK